MGIYSLAPLLSTLIYAVLSLLVLRKARSRPRTLFAVYLIISLLFALDTYITVSGIAPDHLRLTAGLLPIGGVGAVVAHYHFVSAFTRRPSRVAVWAGYATLLFIFAPLAVRGYFPVSVQLVDGGLHVDHGLFLYPLGGIGFVFGLMSMLALTRALRSSKDAVERSRMMYLMVGMGLFICLGIREVIPPMPKVPLNQIGHLLNALVIAYVIHRYRLLDARILVRRWLAYAGITASLAFLFFGVLFTINDVLAVEWSSPTGLTVTSCAVVLMAAVFHPMKTVLDRMASRIVYGSRYDYRTTVLAFASKLSNVLELDELADTLLKSVVSTVSASQASLLFKDGDRYKARFAERMNAGEPVIPISLRTEGLVISWLESENKPLHRESIDSEAQFKGLWREDRQALDAAQVELLCPIMSRRKLVAILALIRKHPRGDYGGDDADLLMTFAHEASVAIENAMRYERARQRANTDELTGLFNHRHFYQRLDEEIARSSRFGGVFSLVMLDMDNFRVYNEAYGHFAGDKVLETLGKTIDQSIRGIDSGFRYGGDEFSIVMPQTPPEQARKAAERLRKAIEARTDLEGMPLSCSIGVATWPTDGVMREEVVQSADAALYQAKRSGGNRVCLASEVALSQAMRAGAAHDSRNRDAVLSTIYALAATVDAKDHYTYGHSKKVSRYATDIAEALGYSPDGVERIRAAALLHDIGKIGISDRLLGQREPLRTDDWDVIHSHPDLGVAILKHVDGLADCLPGVQYHHERYDGTGYPANLKGENIPLDARILAVADAFDAMTTERPYRPWKRSREEALQELERHAGSQFDPRVVEVFARIVLEDARLPVAVA